MPIKDFKTGPRNFELLLDGLIGIGVARQGYSLGRPTLFLQPLGQELRRVFLDKNP
jgi:hypothetical protein